MKYALGNMLNGAGGLNADQLALDLQFAADKSLTARKGPTPTFTRSSSGTFVGSNGLIQSAATNVARFDHDPVTLASRGLLIEGSRTNLWSRSEELSTSPWFAVNTTTFVANDIASPDGAQTADRIIVGSTTQSYGTFNNQITFVTGTTYTASCFFKANQITRVAIQSANTVILPIVAIFDLTGSGSIVGTPTGTASIQQFGNGWYRCSVTGSAASNGVTSIRLLAVSGTSLTYPGNGVDSFYAWGAQLEAGSHASSYIPTTTASVVRSADVCSITGAAFSEMWNASEGSMFINADPSMMAASETSNRTFGTISNASYATQTGFGKRSTILRTDFYINGAQFNAANSQNLFKGAIGLKNGDNAGAYNGSIVATSTTNIQTVDRLSFRDVTGNSNGDPFVIISSFRYYRKRLPNAKLQALTA